MIGDNLFIFEDFTMRTSGELVRLANGTDTDFHECAITTDPTSLCSENSTVGKTGLASGAIGPQRILMDMSSVKEGSKIQAMASAVGGVSNFFITYSTVTDPFVIKTLHSSSNSHWLLSICTELGIVTMRNTLDTQAPSIVEVPLSAEIRQRIRDRDFRLGVEQVSGHLQCINISEVDLVGNGYQVSGFTGSRFQSEYDRTSKVDGSFDENPESVVELHNETIRYVSSKYINSVGIHKIVAKDKSSSIGKKLMLVEDDGTLVEPNFRDVDDVDRHPQTVWFVEGAKMRSNYKFKLVGDVQ